MGAHIINGKAIAEDLKERVAAEVKQLAADAVRPGLATLMVGADYAAEAYERRVRRLAEELDCYYVREILLWTCTGSVDCSRLRSVTVRGKESGATNKPGLPTGVSPRSYSDG